MRSTFVSEADSLKPLRKLEREDVKAVRFVQRSLTFVQIQDNFVYINTISAFASSFYEALKFLWRLRLKLVTNSFCECKLV